MRTYGQLFRTPEFTPFFLTCSVQVAATTVGGLALATLVFRSTGSALLSALSMFGPSLAQVLGATLLLSAADRLPPRSAMTAVALVVGAGTAVLAVPGLPLWAVFTVLLVEGLVTSVGGGVRYGLLSEILPKDGYLLGRSVLNMSVGTMQIAGYATGGVLLAVLSPRGALLTAAALGAASAVLAAAGLSSRPPRTAGRPSVAETWRTNSRLWSSPARRTVFLALWVPNGLIVGCESLFVPYDPRNAGLLFACAAFGMLIGDTLAGRFLPPRRRERLGAPLRLLLALPYLVFVCHPAAPFAAAAATLASIGFASSLLLQESLIALTPDDIQGQALGLDTSGRLTMQGVAAALAGAVAQYTLPATAITVMALASVIVTLALAPGLRPERIAAALGPAGDPASGSGR
ncbi:MFS transporter [Streptomyces sp. NBC_01317]|uniref:MFS transporter n=1 Tax=Streptomyces sp. NBC_01317 TaxID=2903822 RepID=UPI002E11B9DE|nr:MFS transporter [Streptomyces sp. NBC_01317]